jgi:uncharacterized membrane protein YgdD (TMEM256/DUF423 family)
MSYGLRMSHHDRARALAEFKRTIAIIAAIGVLMVIGALIYLAMTGELQLHMVVATIGGVFFSVLLGCGLFAAAFFSDKSGHDQNVTDASKSQRTFR